MCSDIDEDAIGPLWKGATFPMSTCVSGWAMLDNHTVAIPDIARDEGIPQELHTGTFVRALAMAHVGPEGSIVAIGASASGAHSDA
jgi:hypothetical protein